MSSLISDLEPITRGLCEALIREWEHLRLPSFRLTHTLRSFDEQLHLWMKGRLMENGIWRVVDPARVVTKAMPGESPHNYGAAFDICFRGPDPYLHTHEAEHGKPDPLWHMIGETGTRLGLNWGGPLGEGDRFTWDSCHFERSDWKVLKA